MIDFFKILENAASDPMVFKGCRGYVVPCTQQHGAYIAENLREADRLELERFYPWPPEEVIRRSILGADMAWAGVNENNVPVSIWGVATAYLGYGVPWMLGTPLVDKYKRETLVFSKHFDRIITGRYRFLWNYVDATYKSALRWLRWLGYQEGPIKRSEKDWPFICMYKRVEIKEPNMSEPINKTEDNEDPNNGHLWEAG
jgi:hypothetical protein